MTENWKPIPGLETFFVVSDRGNVGILVAGRNGDEIKLINPHLNEGGYKVASFPNLHPKKRHYLVHYLVMLAFVGERPEGMQVNHKNAKKIDNRLSNLEYCTRQENIDHARKMGRLEGKGKAILNEEQVRSIRIQQSGGATIIGLARQFQVKPTTIRNVVKRRTFKHID